MASIQQIKLLIVGIAAAAVWPSTPGNVVYSAVVPSEDVEGLFSPGSVLLDGPKPLTLPFCRVSFRDLDMDAEVNGRIDEARFWLWSTAGGGDPWPGTTAQAPPGFDTHGINMESGLLVADVNPAGQSQGKTTDQLWSALVASIGTNGRFNKSTHGFQGSFSRVSQAVPVNGVQVLTRPIEIKVFDATVSDT